MRLTDTEVLIFLVILAVTVIPISFCAVYTMSREIDMVIKRCDSIKRWAKTNLDEEGSNG